MFPIVIVCRTSHHIREVPHHVLSRYSDGDTRELVYYILLISFQQSYSQGFRPAS